MDLMEIWGPLCSLKLNWDAACGERRHTIRQLALPRHCHHPALKQWDNGKILNPSLFQYVTLVLWVWDCQRCVLITVQRGLAADPLLALPYPGGE